MEAVIFGAHCAPSETELTINLQRLSSLKWDGALCQKFATFGRRRTSCSFAKELSLNIGWSSCLL